MDPNWLVNGDESPRRVILAHGAGQPMDSPFMEAMARGLAGRGFCAIRFEFPYMQERRATGKSRPPDRTAVLCDHWLEVIEAAGGGADLVIGGKSMGGRMASLIADAASVRGLVCLGYPFHPPGKPDRLRTEHLAELATPTLILQGTRDPFGKPEEVQGYDLSASIEVVWVEDGEHSFKPRARSGRTLDENLEHAVAEMARFLGQLE